MEPGIKVYQAIAKITKSLGQQGISKDRQAQGYKFRGIDDIYNALSSELATNNLCIIPILLERQSIERIAKSGNALFYVTVKARFDIVSAEDGSRHEAITYGEAMDSSDKATNKAMSAAYKYMAFMTFCIPTEGDEDIESNTHEVQARDTLMDALKTFKDRLNLCTKADQVSALIANNSKLFGALKDKNQKLYEDAMSEAQKTAEAFQLAAE